MTKRRVSKLAAQTEAVVDAAYTAETTAQRELLSDASETLAAVLRKEAARDAARAANPILEMQEGATPAEIADARRMQSVQVKNTVYLPLWSDVRVGFPNALIRSSLFSANRAESKYLVDEPLYLNDRNISLEYTGPQLTIYDRNVLATCVRICRDTPIAIDEEVRNLVKPLSIDTKGFATLSVYAFCTEMGVSYGADSHDSIVESFNRLDLALVKVNLITAEGYRVSTRIRLLEVINVSIKGKSKGSDKISFKIHPALAQLYGKNAWSALPDETFRHNGLKGALLGYYGTHGKPFAVQIEALQNFSKIQGRLAIFRVMLSKALDALKDESVDESSRVESYVLSKSLTHIVVFMKRWQVTSAARRKVLADLEAWSQKPVTKKTIKVRIAN